MTPDLVKVYCALFAAVGVSMAAVEWTVRIAAPLVVIAYTIWKWRREATGVASNAASPREEEKKP